MFKQFLSIWSVWSDKRSKSSRKNSIIISSTNTLNQLGKDDENMSRPATLRSTTWHVSWKSYRSRPIKKKDAHVSQSGSSRWIPYCQQLSTIDFQFSLNPFIANGNESQSIIFKCSTLLQSVKDTRHVFVLWIIVYFRTFRYWLRRSDEWCVRRILTDRRYSRERITGWRVKTKTRKFLRLF